MRKRILISQQGLKENKFGIPSDTVFETYQYAATLPNLDIIGIDCHIGSQLTETQPFVDALDRVDCDDRSA